VKRTVKQYLPVFNASLKPNSEGWTQTDWFAWPYYAAFTGCAVSASVINYTVTISWRLFLEGLFLWNNEWSNSLQVSYANIGMCMPWC